MTKTQLIAEIAKKSEVSKKVAETVFEATLELIGDSLAAGEKVQITGFGTFEVREHGERNGRNPYTKEQMVIPPSKRPAFVAGKSLKDKVAK